MAAGPERTKRADYSELKDAAYQELRSFSRSIAELEWLLLALVLLYSQVPGTRVDNAHALLITMIVFAAFILAFRYLNFYERESRWKLAFESWVMIGFVTASLWHTGMVESPLVNGFLLVIIASALTLGKLMTLLEVALICCIYFFMGFQVYGQDVFSLLTFSELMARFAPFLLVAYITTMLSADIQFSKGLLRVQSEEDELTGIMNMRGFRNVLAMEVRQHRRYGRPFTVMMVDSDGLKPINDDLGHEAGNRIIQLTARTIEDCLRGSDVLARYGGDEFIVLLRETSIEAAGPVAERIRTAIANTSIDIAGRRVGVTVSIGLAGAPGDGRNADELIEKADRALYVSKEGGRNRVTTFAPAPEPAAAAAEPPPVSAARS